MNNAKVKKNALGVSVCVCVCVSERERQRERERERDEERKKRVRREGGREGERDGGCYIDTDMLIWECGSMIIFTCMEYRIIFLLL